jgi:predicted  nucleic acid-binding Zn-ribbon protein
VLKDLSLLIELQELDLKIEKNRIEEKKLSSQREGERKRVLELEDNLLEKKEILKHIQIERRDKERNIEEFNSFLAKHEEEKYKIKSKEEFAALEKEISQGEEKKNKTEDVLLELMEKEEGLREELPALEKESKQANKNYQQKDRILRIDLDSTIEQLKHLENNRKKHISQLNSLVFQRYEQLQKTRENPVVLPLSNGICGGCNVKVPPSLIARVRRRGEIVYCENCTRILYMDNS